ncbi:MAG: PilZ domain-containing protein [Methylococcales bacterium]
MAKWTARNSRNGNDSKKFGYDIDKWPVRLIDVSQLGVSIACGKKLRCGQRLLLMLTFQDGQSFEFDAVISNRRSGDEDMTYGIKFERSNHQFEEHLLKTGLKIKLKNLSTTE